MDNLLITTTSGIVQGIEKETCCAYLGIPYAKCQRFMPPEPYHWNGVLPCTAYGSKSLGTTFCRTIPKNQEIQMFGSEDCLNLNIWTPRNVAPGKKLPVVFYVHGGGYQIGSNSSVPESGELFLKDEPEMVFVSVNYRLGIQGFLEWGEVLGEKYRYSSNNGLRDVIAALKWVHKNITQFHGDPDHVTLTGLSAGAKTVAVMTICPEVRHMFQQIICESGAVQSLRPLDTAQKLTRKYLALLGTEDPEVILTMDPYKLLEAQIRMSDTQGSTLYYGPVFEEGLFPENWKDDFRNGTGWKGRAMMGSCRNELFASFQRDYLYQAQETIDGLFGVYADYARAEYDKMAAGRELTEDEQRKIWVKVTSDFMYRTYNDRFSTWLSKYGSKVWNYSVEFRTACHTYGFNLVVGNFQPIPMKVTLKPEDMPDAMKVHASMKGRYVNFIVNGDPNGDGLLTWPNWTGDTRTKYCFNTEDSIMESAVGDTITTFPEYMYKL